MTSVSFDVFLSHNSKDKLVARQLAQALTQRDLRVWFDEDELLPGQTWMDALEHAILNSASVAVLIGPNDMGPWQVPEMRAAIDLSVRHGIPVIPVLLPGAPAEPDIPLFLQQYDYVDVRNGITPEGIDRLVAGINAGIKEKRKTKRRKRTPGKLHNVPELPRQFLQRPQALDSLKQTVLGAKPKIGITGVTRPAGSPTEPSEQRLPRRSQEFAPRSDGSSSTGPTTSAAQNRHCEDRVPEGRGNLNPDLPTQRIGVQGMGGIGKTVLAAALAREDDIRKAFPDGVVWLTLGQTPPVTALQSELVRIFEGTTVSFGLPGLGKNHLRRLFEDKACLVILDDVWQSEHAGWFDALGPNGRLLITTRDADVLHAVDAHEWRIDILDEDHALELLARWAGQEVAQLPPAAHEVAAQCSGLPLALTICGALARDDTPWDHLRDALREHDLEFLDHPQGSVMKSLSVSVDALPDADAQRYRDLAVFPEDTPIPEAAITTLWCADNTFKDRHAAKLIGTLSRKALLTATGKTPNRRITLHDLQRDFILATLAKDGPDAFECATRDLHNRLIDAYNAQCPNGWHTGPNDGYFFTHLAHHLAQAGQTDELRNLLFSFPWLQTKLDTTNINALLADYDHLPNDKTAQLVQGALRLSAHILTDDKTQLAPHLHGRLGSMDADEVRALLRDAVPPTHPWLRPRAPSLMPPGGPLLRTFSDVSAVSAVSILPDDKRAISGTYVGTLKLWNLQCGSLIHTFEGHRDWVSAIATLPDGKRALSASHDNTLKLWDLQSGWLIHTFEGHSDWVSAIAILPDGKRALSASLDNTLKLWDLQSGSLIHTLHGHSGKVRAIAALPDSKRALSGSLDSTVKLWDLQSGSLIRTLEGHSSFVVAVVPLPDGKRALSSSHDNTLRLWNLQSGALIHNFQGHRGWIRAVAVLPDGKHALSAAGDGTLKLWNLQSGDLVRTYQAHSRPVIAIAVLPDGKHALSASFDNSLKLWHLQSGKLVNTFEGHSEHVNVVAILPYSNRALSGSLDSTLKLWHLKSRSLTHTLGGHSGIVSAVAILPDAKRVLSGSHDNALKLWDLQSGDLIHTLQGHSTIVTAIAILPDGKHALSSSWDKTLKLWDLDSGDLIHTLRGHSERVKAIAVLLDGRHALSASYDNTLRLWDLQSGELIYTFLGHSEWIRTVAVLPDGRHALSSSWDKTLKLWDLQSGALIHTLQGHTSAITAVAILPDGKHAISGSYDRTVRLWDLESGSIVSTLKGHSARISALAVLPDGKHALSASEDHTLKLWDLEADSVVRTLEDHSAEIFTVRSLPDGRLTVSSSSDKTLKLWDPGTGRTVACFFGEGGITCCAVSHDGRDIVAGERSGRVHFLELVDDDIKPLRD